MEGSQRKQVNLLVMILKKAMRVLWHNENDVLKFKACM
jgi:hypothetical protein